MHEVALFVEDGAHQRVVGAILQRVAEDRGVTVRLDWRNAAGGRGQMAQELKRYLRDLTNQGGHPDLIVVATDANCVGLRQRVKDINAPAVISPMVLAIPDPHIERWLLLDGAAFRTVFGRGCDAPDRKCDRGRYKHQLFQAVNATGVAPQLGGIEYAEEIIRHMDIEGAARADPSFRRFVNDLRRVFQQWDVPPNDRA